MGCDWRLLTHGAGTGAWNMGVDEALLASAQQGQAALRLYAWDGPWLSLGYGQKLSDERHTACETAGVGIVRRMTGGLAVLHGADLTYTVAAPADALPPSLCASYRLVADALCAAFLGLGVALERAPLGPDGERATGRRTGFDCFAAPAPNELLAGGRKIAGSAQRRTGGAVLQHGSIRITPDLPEVARAAGLDPSRSTSLQELGAACDLEEVIAAVVGGFEEALGLSPEPDTLSSAECRVALERGSRPMSQPVRSS